MKQDRFDEKLRRAIDQLKKAPIGDDLRGFERGVWVEISLHDGRMITRIARLIRDGMPAFSARTAYGSVACAVLLGIASALIQSNSYGESRSAALEERYVSSIHAVLRSEFHEPRHPQGP